ncbi:hypothetical protein D3C87_1843440 [compost metagenome]
MISRYFNSQGTNSYRIEYAPGIRHIFRVPLPSLHKIDERSVVGHTLFQAIGCVKRIKRGLVVVVQMVITCPLRVVGGNPSKKAGRKTGVTAARGHRVQSLIIGFH